MWHLAYTATSLTVGEVVYARGSVTSLGRRLILRRSQKERKSFAGTLEKKKSMRAPGITQQLQKHRTMSVLLMERRRSIFATWPPSPLAMLIEARNRMCCQRDTPLNLCQDSFEDIQCYRAAMGKHLDTTHLMSPSVYDGCPPTDAASCGQADTARVRTHARTHIPIHTGR